jgi:molybdenum-dependent DNA-binding transcriptional regulator ModE
MNNLYSELGVLSRAVAYQNLSGAAVHVGLSQPQLSRIVAKIERELGIQLLDREKRRKSAWTKIAHQLAETYLRSHQSLRLEIQKLQGQPLLEEIRVGTLEGLVPMALELAQRLLKGTKLMRVELDVYDLNALEEHFLSSDLDWILTFREPGRRKFKFNRILGYQTLETVGAEADSPRVMSLYEYRAQVEGKRSEGTEPKTLVSNSLMVRKLWLETWGGRGVVPGGVRSEKRGSKNESPVILLAQDRFPDPLWKAMQR